MLITEMLPKHYPDVARIYEAGIETKIATFNTKAPSYLEFDQGHLKCCRLVAMARGKIMGWAALSLVSSRPCYKGVAEVSLYIDPIARGRGIGQALLEEIIRESEANGIWTLQSSIISINDASVKVHEKCGFRVVGIRQRIGKIENIGWMDVTLMERRSPVVANE